MTKARALFYIFVLVIIAGFALPVPKMDSPQRARMNAAAQHITKLAPLIAEDPAFSQVTCDVFTGSNGSLSICGQIADEVTFDRLRSIAESSNPPVTVVFMLQSDTRWFSGNIERP